MLPLSVSLPSREQRQAYLLLRLLIGLNFFMHGFARIFTGSHLAGFAHGMAKGMAATPLPHSLVLAIGYIIPCCELILGGLLLLGLLTRATLTASLLFMIVLMFGVTLKQDWSAAGDQLIYGAVLAALLWLCASHDTPLWPKRRERPAR